MSRGGRGASVVRVVTYRYDVPRGFTESLVEAELQRAHAQGVVTEFDTGRGRFVWFSGRPGLALREVRDRVVALLGPSARRVGAEEG